MSYKIDLHTHSVLSHDGGISEQEYTNLLSKKILDFVAITDHNQIDFALKLNKKFPKQIIVGEEVKTLEGDVIGLFLTKLVPLGLSAKETMEEIKRQNGLVYIPHPFQTKVSGVSLSTLNSILKDVDIIESYNQRRGILYRDTSEVENYIKLNNICSAFGSDSHIVGEIGKTYNLIRATPTKENLTELLSKSRGVKNKVSIKYLFSPKFNKLKKMFFNV